MLRNLRVMGNCLGETHDLERALAVRRYAAAIAAEGTEEGGTGTMAPI